MRTIKEKCVHKTKIKMKKNHDSLLLRVFEKYSNDDPISPQGLPFILYSRIQIFKE